MPLLASQIRAKMKNWIRLKHRPWAQHSQLSNGMEREMRKTWGQQGQTVWVSLPWVLQGLEEDAWLVPPRMAGSARAWWQERERDMQEVALFAYDPPRGPMAKSGTDQLSDFSFIRQEQ